MTRKYHSGNLLKTGEQIMNETRDYRNGTYTAFYVDEPFVDGKTAVTAPDFNYYNLLKAWKENDPSFKFINSHDKTYEVRDGSDFENTLVPRIRKRLRNSKNIILFLSSHTKQSKALKEEIEYGAITLGLPIIVVYPELDKESQITDNGKLTQYIKNLIATKLPILDKAMKVVPTAHILMKKAYISGCINYGKLTVQGKENTNYYYYKG